MLKDLANFFVGFIRDKSFDVVVAISGLLNINKVVLKVYNFVHI